MHNMVRILVGTMLEVGTGRRSGLVRAPARGQPPRGCRGNVPAHGLYLASVAY